MSFEVGDKIVRVKAPTAKPHTVVAKAPNPNYPAKSDYWIQDLEGHHFTIYGGDYTYWEKVEPKFEVGKKYKRKEGCRINLVEKIDGDWVLLTFTYSGIPGAEFIRLNQRITFDEVG